MNNQTPSTLREILVAYRNADESSANVSDYVAAEVAVKEAEAKINQLFEDVLGVPDDNIYTNYTGEDMRRGYNKLQAKARDRWYRSSK